jgi:hypothetical protein
MTAELANVSPIRKPVANRFDAQWLLGAEFPPIKYVVPGIIPEGLTLLVAAPKVGKSWLVLAIAVYLSTGHDVLGIIEVGKARPVLYLALEDGKARLQSRLLFMGVDVSPMLEFVISLDGQGVVEVIGDYVKDHAGEDPIVILDTLGKVMPGVAGNQTQYGHEYSVMAALKATCDAVPGSSLIVVHHTRKAESGDFLDSVSGTQGLAGAADSILVLKRERQGDKATLQVTSRDAAEGEYSLVFRENGLWELDGNSIQDAADAARKARATAGVGDRMAEVIEAVNAHPEGITPAALDALLPSLPNIRVYLRRALDAGRIQNPSRGLYTPVTSVTSVTSSSDETRKVTQVTEVTPLSGVVVTDCSACGNPLHQSLIDDKETIHPGCDDDD